MSDEQPPQAPRPRLVVPASGDGGRPRTRLIAPAVVEPEYAPDPVEEEPLPEETATEAVPHVSPLSPPASADESEPETDEDDLGEAEQGEFTVINEDTGETHTVPVRVSSMEPPTAADEEPEAAEEPETPEQEFAEVEPEPVAEQPDYGGYASAEEQQAAIDYEQAQQQAYYEQSQAATPVMAAPALAYQQPALRQQFQQPPQHAYPPQQPYAPQHPGYPPQQAGGYPPAHGGYPYPMIKPTRSVPSWALLFIGLLVGFIVALVLFKFTEFGPMLRPPESMIKKD